jgi:hypothetical protein
MITDQALIPFFIRNLLEKESYHPGEHLFKSQKSDEALKVSSVHNLVKAWCKAARLKGNYGSHTLRKTWGYHQRVTYRVDIPPLMVCFNHATQKQTLDYLCIRPEEITNVFNDELYGRGRDFLAFVLLMPANIFGRVLSLQNASILRQSISLQFILKREFNFVLRIPIPTRFWQMPIVD